MFEFDYGASNEGDWNYDRMVLQLESCVNVLNCLYPQYDFLFLFDNSCGHDKQHEILWGATVNTQDNSDPRGRGVS